MNDRQSSLDDLVKALDDIIAKVASEDLHETVTLLSIARLDLVLRANGFSETDLDAVLSPLREDLVDNDARDAPKPKTRRVKNAPAVGHC